MGFQSGDGSFINTPATGTLRFFKIDADAKDYVSDNGNASLEGAIYDVYAAEDILSFDHKGFMIYNGVECKKDALIATGIIENGEFTIEKLPIGKYYVKERAKEVTEAGKVSFAKGYLVDENVYGFEIPYTNESYKVEVATSSRDERIYDKYTHVTDQATISGDKVIDTDVRITKLTQNTGETEMRVLAGAGFSLYRISDLSKFNEFADANGNYDLASIIKAYENKKYSNSVKKYDFSKETKAFKYVDGKKVVFEETFSDEDGQLVFTDVAFGKYLLVETTVPNDVFVVDPVIIDVNENTKPVSKMIYLDDEGFEAYLQLVKFDIETGKEVVKNNASFAIFKENGERVVMTDTVSGFLPRRIDTFTTNDEGILTLPELLSVGDYVLKELSAPHGFYNASTVDGYEVSFKVSTNRVYEAVGTDLSTNRDVIKNSRKHNSSFF